MATSTGATYTLGGVVEEVVGKNLRLFPILFSQFKHIQYAFFDVKELAGQGGQSLKPRSLAGIDSSLTVDGYSVKWLDYSMFDFNTTVTSTAASLAVTSGDITLVVGDTSGFAANDTIYIVKSPTGTSDEINGIVKSVTNSTTLVVTVTGVNGSTTIPGTVAVLAAQTVERGFWRRNDNDEILRSSGKYNYAEFKSTIQHFSRRISFTKAQLNKVYKYEGEAKEEASKEFIYNLAIMFQEVNKAIYKGRNVVAGAGALDKMEMLGLETVTTECGTRKVISSPTAAYDELIGELNISYQSSSGLGSNEPLMMIVNDEFLTELSKIERAKVQHNIVVKELDLEIQRLSTIYGSVTLLRDPMLSRLYRTGTAFIVPRSMVKLWVRENQEFEPKKGITRADQSVRLYEVITNLREQKSYDMEFELGLIAGGMSLGTRYPIRMITNFKTPALVS